MRSAAQFVSSFDRPNIRYTIVEKREPFQQLLRFIASEHQDPAGHDSGIVYCQSRRKVEETAEWLSREGISALPYHAGMAKEAREVNQNAFMTEPNLVMAATIATDFNVSAPACVS